MFSLCEYLNKYYQASSGLRQSSQHSINSITIYSKRSVRARIYIFIFKDCFNPRHLRSFARLHSLSAGDTESQPDSDERLPIIDNQLNWYKTACTDPKWAVK